VYLYEKVIYNIKNSYGELIMPNPEFLESYPLYKKFEVLAPATLDRFQKPSIKLFCSICKSKQTFSMINEWFSFYSHSNFPAAGLVILIAYECVGCGEFHQYFTIKISDNLDYIMKVGQFPPWEIDVDKDLRPLLGKHIENYKKGLVCESQGYGICAYAYYRRIIEEIIDELLDSIKDLIDEEDLEAYKEALKKTKKSHVAQEKIEIVKDMIPQVLRPDGMNPLKLLHESLSEGLHSLPDEECLEQAGLVRGILEFLVKEIIRHRDSSKVFTESMKKLLEKKSLKK
jgi:hypothetical protein